VFSSFLNLLTDPILQSSSLGSMLMCFSSSLIGVLVLLRKRSLIGETLSHASFPGIILSSALVDACCSSSQEWRAIPILLGSAISALIGFKMLEFLENQLKVKTDSALCFVLASFFGFGILMASHLQQIAPVTYQEALIFVYGQAATMTSLHVLLYGGFAVLTLGFILYFYRYLEAVIFDPVFAETLGIRSKKIDHVLFLLIVVAIVIGIRCVGIVLMAGMLIAPAVAAKPLTKSLSSFLVFSAFFGVVSAFVGNYLSVVTFHEKYSLPTGPMILLIASGFAVGSLLFSSKNGVVGRHLRARRFRLQCAIENALKKIWKEGIDRSPLDHKMRKRLYRLGWINREGLTLQGREKAEKIVRLHRLWEVYLVDYLGQRVDRVHQTAEELEHLILPGLEKDLTIFLKNPLNDPHHQKIPPVKGVYEEGPR